MNVKYQVFVSSTYEDLKQHREQVIKAILEMGHIPVGMEMFSAADQEQWKLIERQIDQSDYYAVIVAHRYGSTTSEGVSYTEKEYDYAVSAGVPVIGFVVDNATLWPPDCMENDVAKQEALKQFVEKVKRKHVGFWNSPEDLHGKFSIALMKLINTNPRLGWVPSSQAAGPEVTKELTRLSAENADLRRKLEDAEQRERQDDQTENEKILRTLAINDVNVSIKYKGDSEWREGPKETLYEIFDLLAPQLATENTLTYLAMYTAVMLNDKEGEKVSSVPKNHLQMWLADLMTLGLVEPSKKRHSVSDKEEYWTLTDKGREILHVIRRDRLERALVDPATEPRGIGLAEPAPAKTTPKAAARKTRPPRRSGKTESPGA